MNLCRLNDTKWLIEHQRRWHRYHQHNDKNIYRYSGKLSIGGSTVILHKYDKRKAVHLTHAEIDVILARMPECLDFSNFEINNQSNIDNIS
ncbi:hypothetical protein Turpa_1768 [Turneriella parva DSM 21527]|uniref:Uncharacterized protein n=1 Tax=Turneriella parva (strain ATCC BAA-1111 / DSM 21527 / NCTC 11395 / H) TaxID=869212 RepID=I4B558_TURPD|nr:hypothetical protein Turpa_1768 [Turneriella parva DSM 21527]